MTTCNTGSIVLLRFPFTDLTSTKRRPVLVINPIEFSIQYGDIVVLPLSGQPQQQGAELIRWREAGLLKRTWLKPLIATVAESLVERHLGRLHVDDEDKVASVLGILIAEKYAGG
jgi:mRNA interferase MazF